MNYYNHIGDSSGGDLSTINSDPYCYATNTDILIFS